MKINYIYLLKEREFINTGEDIYKVGKTEQVNHERLKQYPKSSALLLQKICIDRHKMERLITTEFKKKFIRRKDIGNEYFEGDYHKMILIIEKHINAEREEYNKDKEDDSESESEANKCVMCKNVFASENQLLDHNCKIKFICRKCKRGFSKKSHYIDHKNRKFPCVASQEDIDKRLACIKCNKRYSTSGNLREHLKTCGKNVNINIYIQKRSL